MPTSTTDKMNGAANTAKGKAKRIGGEITDNEDLKAEGSMDKRLEARIQKFMGTGMSRVEATAVAQLPKRLRKACNPALAAPLRKIVLGGPGSPPRRRAR